MQSAYATYRQPDTWTWPWTVSRFGRYIKGDKRCEEKKKILRLFWTDFPLWRKLEKPPLRSNFQRMFTLFVLAGRFLLERRVTATRYRSLRPVHTTCQTNKLSLQKTHFWIKILHSDCETNLQQRKQSYEKKVGIHLLTEDNSVGFYTFSASSEETEHRLCHCLCFCSPFKQLISGKTKTSTLSDEPTPKPLRHRYGAAGGPKFCPTFSFCECCSTGGNFLLWFETSQVGTGYNFFLSAGVIQSLPLWGGAKWRL